MVPDTRMVVVVCVFGGLRLHGSDFFQHVPQIVDQIGIWELRRRGRHLMLFCPVPQSVLPPGSVVMRGVHLVTNNAWMAAACQVDST